VIWGLGCGVWGLPTAVATPLTVIIVLPSLLQGITSHIT